MTRIFALPAALAASLLGGCASGQIGPLPPVLAPSQAADVTVFRDGSWVGFFAPITLRIDGRQVFNVKRNEQYSFQLDPGEHLFDFTIGLNECRGVALLYPRENRRYRLAPNCAKFDWGW
jgi:hypothetical protein